MASKDKSFTRERHHKVDINHLYLDPNNYRFINEKNYIPVDDIKVLDDDVQSRTYKLIIGKNAENIKELIDSFVKNGYLPVDQIQVRQIDNENYLVVEGNRRVACLIYLQQNYETEHIELGKFDQTYFSKLPVVSYQDIDDYHHLVLMGLKHISGNKKWPPINQAKLIKDLSEKHNLPPDDVCKSIGINKLEYFGALDTLALIQEYQNSEYGDQFKSQKYSFFREIVKDLKFKKWLDWDEKTRSVKNFNNRKRLFSWLSEELDDDLDNEEESDSYLFTSKKKREPVLQKAAQIRDLAKIIDDETALKTLDETRSILKATITSDSISKDKTKNAIELIEEEISNLFIFSSHISENERAKIDELANKMLGIVNIKKLQDISSTISFPYVFDRPACHFSHIKIKKFRRLNNTSFDNLSRINIFAGINNSGKTTILEAIKILSSLNSPNILVEIISKRAKESSKKVEMKWFVEQLTDIQISGIFNNLEIDLKITNIQNEKIEDRTYYLKSSNFEIKINNELQKSQTHYFEKYRPNTDGQVRALCPSIFTSPFTLFDDEIIEESYSQSLKTDHKQILVEFIKNNLDPKILNIELDQNHRFIVNHEYLKPNPDLSKFGDGLQKIFKIGLLFAKAENGIILIDEFENAIHPALLSNFINLIYQLAKKFNVQIFITTHSNECIAAFVNNPNIEKDEISAYGLINKNHEIITAYFSGSRLAELMQLIGFDLRDGKSK